MTPEERAEKGAALLDERLPGWRTQIDVDGLELRWCSACVLGQLFGDYDRGVAALGLTKQEEREYGFWVPRESWYTRLTEAWRKLVTA